MLAYYVTFVVTVYGEFFGEPKSSPYEMSGGFISQHAKPHKTRALDLGFMRLEDLLGLLNPRIDKKSDLRFTGS